MIAEYNRSEILQSSYGDFVRRIGLDFTSYACQIYNDVGYCVICGGGEHFRCVYWDDGDIPCDQLSVTKAEIVEATAVIITAAETSHIRRYELRKELARGLGLAVCVHHRGVQPDLWEQA